MRFNCHFETRDTDERKSVVVALTAEEVRSIESLRAPTAENPDEIAQAYALRHTYAEMPRGFTHSKMRGDPDMSTMSRDRKIDAMIAEFDARTEQTRAQCKQQFKFVLASTGDKKLLDLAEAAGNADGAVTSIATTVGYPLTNFSDDLQLQIAFRNIILNRLILLQPTAIALNYAWYYAGTADALGSQ